jgi:ABC-2 type transport system permease protein
MNTAAFLQIIKGTWAEYMMYRLNFVMWRVRMVMQLLITYFLWWAIFGTKEEFFGYTQTMILTYIMLTAIVRTIVLGTTTMEIGDLINQGNLSNYLVKPIHFFSYYWARDIADKALNLFFAIGELTILFILLRPPIFIQTDPLYLGLTAFAIILGIILYFYFSLILGFLGFWTPDIWGPRFISFVVMEFFAGTLFPLDILPKTLFWVSQALPFSYFIYFPLKVYTGQIEMSSIIGGFCVAIAWTGGLYALAMLMWRRGLKAYTAEGK